MPPNVVRHKPVSKRIWTAKPIRNPNSTVLRIGYAVSLAHAVPDSVPQGATPKNAVSSRARKSRSHPAQIPSERFKRAGR